MKPSRQRRAAADSFCPTNLLYGLVTPPPPRLCPHPPHSHPLCLFPQVFVRAFAGFDASEAFLSYHRRRFPHDKMSRFSVGAQRRRKAAEVDSDYLELCELVEKVLPQHKSFAPWSYYVKIVLLLGAAVGLEVYMHWTARY